MTQAFNPSTWEDKAERSLEFETTLVSKSSSSQPSLSSERNHRKLVKMYLNNGPHSSPRKQQNLATVDMYMVLALESRI